MAVGKPSVILLLLTVTVIVLLALFSYSSRFRRTSYPNPTPAVQGEDDIELPTHNFATGRLSNVTMSRTDHVTATVEIPQLTALIVHSIRIIMFGHLRGWKLMFFDVPPFTAQNWTQLRTVLRHVLDQEEMEWIDQYAGHICSMLYCVNVSAKDS